MIRHSETVKMSRTLSFFILGGQLVSSGGQTLFSDSLKLQLYQHRSQLNLLKVEVYLKPPHLNAALWAAGTYVTRAATFSYTSTLFAIHKENSPSWVSPPFGRIFKLVFLASGRSRFILAEEL